MKINAEELLACDALNPRNTHSVFNEGYRQCAEDVRTVIKGLVEKAIAEGTKDLPSDGSGLSYRLRIARIAAGLSVNELAKKAGVLPASISQYEHGDHAPRGRRLEVLAEALGVSREWLMGEEESNP